VADLLKARGITRVAMAARLGISLGKFNNTLAGHQTPSQDMRDGLVSELGVPLDELFTAEPLARQQGRRYRAGAKVAAGDDTKIRRLTTDERESRGLARTG
jgi:transcriptional regulator with XRE-family HTH domain